MLHASGDVRVERTVRQVRVRRSANLATRRQRIPRQLPPRLVEREYGLAIVATVAHARRALDRLVHELPSIVAQIARERGDASASMQDASARMDAGVQRIRMLTSHAQTVASLREQELEIIADKFGQRTVAYQRTQINRQIRAALGVDLYYPDENVAALIAHWVHANIALIRGLSARMLADVESAVISGVLAGHTHEQLTAEIERRTGLARNRAALIARDQVQKLFEDVNRARQLEIGIAKFKWRTQRDKRVRPHHRVLEGFTFEYEHPPLHDRKPILPGREPGCFPGETRVSSDAAVEILYRRSYRGKCAVLETDEGGILASTPNHPILTLRGWVPAQFVEVGEYVIEACTKSVESVIANGEHGDPTIQQVFDALAPLGCEIRRTALTGGFHGDGSDQEIDIVDVNRSLRLERDPALSKSFGEQVLVSADRAHPSLCGFDLLFERVLSPSDGIVRGGGKLLTLLLSGDTHAEIHRGRTIAWLHAVADELSANGLSRDAEVFRHALHTPPVGVELFHHVARVVYGMTRRTIDATARLNVPSAEVLAEIVGIHGQHSSCFSESVRTHQPRRVVKKLLREFVGTHVYNLQTSTSWYVAQNRIVHNCRCQQEPVFADLIAALG